MKIKRILFIAIPLLIIIVALVFIFINKDDDNSVINNKVKKVKQEEKKLQIFDESSNKRPIAVMIPNDSWGGAQDRHYGLQKAYLVYEIIAEGNITRFEAIFKDQNIEKIGPVRSSRHYYLDYALENDAIYVHYGWSPQAESDIATLGINNLNGISNPSNMFWRDENFTAPNNAYTSTEKIYEAAKNKKYSLTSDKYQNLNYSFDDVDYKDDETYKSINEFDVKYSSSHVVSYSYDIENHYYLRSHLSGKHIDNETGNQIHVKNIIVLEMAMTTIDDYGRNDLHNKGQGNGYYVTDGGIIDIIWKKDSRESKTKYFTLNNEEIKINDGNTWIQIVPSLGSVTYNLSEEQYE